MGTPRKRRGPKRLYRAATDPAAAFAIAVEALARVRALEMLVLFETEQTSDSSAEEILAAHEERVQGAKERLLRAIGEEELALREMLRGMGIGPPDEGEGTSGSPGPHPT